MQIDCYGFPATSTSFRNKKLAASRIRTAGETTYICFHDSAVRPIHRVSTDPENGDTVIEWAVGAWENAADLKFHSLNQIIEVAEGTVEAWL